MEPVPKKSEFGAGGPFRNKQGLCAQCDYDDPGKLIAGMDGQGGRASFAGYYKDSTATSKRPFLMSLKAETDEFRRNAYYFLDRLGDTFRWHPENVATAQASQVIARHPAVAEVNVYGVNVPDHDGRAGIGGPVPETWSDIGYDFVGFYQHVSNRLPKYAVPLFIRFVPSMTLTGTMKQEKMEQGIGKVPEDQRHYYRLHNQTRVPFTAEYYAHIVSGNVKL